MCRWITVHVTILLNFPHYWLTNSLYTTEMMNESQNDELRCDCHNLLISFLLLFLTFASSSKSCNWNHFFSLINITKLSWKRHCVLQIHSYNIMNIIWILCGRQTIQWSRRKIVIVHNFLTAKFLKRVFVFFSSFIYREVFANPFFLFYIFKVNKELVDFILQGQ